MLKELDCLDTGGGRSKGYCCCSTGGGGTVRETLLLEVEEVNLVGGGFFVECGWTGLTRGEGRVVDVGGRRNQIREMR